MALGMISAGLGIAQGVGGLLGGGGPRQPRMNRCQQQQMQQNPHQQQMMHQMMQMMSQMMNQMQGQMMGGQGRCPQGPCCQQGMNGANNFCGPGGFPQNPMGNMFGQQGPSININIGGGNGFNNGFGGGFNNFGMPPMMGSQFGMGINLNF